MVCPTENCRCGYHQVLECLNNGQNVQSKLLIENLGNDLHATDAKGNTLLHHSVDHRNAEVTQYLIDAGCNVNAQNARRCTPLMRAIVKEDTIITAMLLKSNADIYATESTNQMNVLFKTFCIFIESLISPANQSQQRILDMLFDKVNRDFSEGEHGLTEFLLKSNNLEKLVVVAFGSENLKRFIIKNGYPVDFAEHWWGYTALHCAMRFARFDSVKILIELGADVDTVTTQGYSLFSCYVQNFQDADENSEILKILLRKSSRLPKADVDNLTGMANLLTCGNKQTVRTLFLSGVNVTSYFSEKLAVTSHMICNRDASVLDLVSEFNVEVNVNKWNSPNDRSCLMYAAEKRCPKTVQFMLDHGADVNCRSFVGTALTSATVHCPKVYSAKDKQIINEAKVTELLLQSGADAQIVARNGQWLIDILSGRRKNELYTRVIVAHLALLGSLNPPSLTDLTRRKIESGPLKAHFCACIRQLEKLKNLSVYGTVTMFKLLTEREDTLASYARNQELIPAFNRAKENISNLESYYLNSLEKRVAKAVGEAKLRGQASLVVGALTGLRADVYGVIVYKIIDYLDRRDLINLCETMIIPNVN